MPKRQPTISMLILSFRLDRKTTNSTIGNSYERSQQLPSNVHDFIEVVGGLDGGEADDRYARNVTDFVVIDGENRTSPPSTRKPR